MWIYEKRLEYPVRITKPDPKMAKLLMAQYGGPDSDVCANKEIVGRRASCRTQIPTPSENRHVRRRFKPDAS